jgi:hypothetical protein
MLFNQPTRTGRKAMAMRITSHLLNNIQRLKEHL